MNLTAAQTLFALEPAAMTVVIVNLLLWAGIGILLYRLMKKKKKGSDADASD